MEQSRDPEPQVLHGLRRLVRDLKAADQPAHTGLTGVVCGETELISFCGQRVQYCGVDVEHLTDCHSFESVIWLLLNGELPQEEELADTIAVFDEAAVIDQSAADTLAGLPLRTRPLELLPLAISLTSYFDPTPMDRSSFAVHSRVRRMVAQLPGLLAAGFGQKISDGRANVSPSQSFAANLLQVLRPDESAPTFAEESAMNSLLICECLHEMRPACFAARYVGSTVNDIVPALRAAASLFVAQLRNDPFEWAATTLQSFESPQHAQTWWVERTSDRMPFGFGSQSDDPRIEILNSACRSLLGCPANIVVEASAKRLERVLRQRELFPTEDWVAARLLLLLGVPCDRIAIAIGVARVVGWAAQTIEQRNSGIPLLPSLRYASDKV